MSNNSNEKNYQSSENFEKLHENFEIRKGLTSHNNSDLSSMRQPVQTTTSTTTASSTSKKK